MTQNDASGDLREEAEAPRRTPEVEQVLLNEFWGGSGNARASVTGIRAICMTLTAEMSAAREN
ncbi:MAG: hypothetical protein ACOC84_04220 [Actinomycetota bacterium]